ncbi:MAG: NAD(P)-dependent oxidoreductase [Thiomicrospira sp.]|nr:MAG: NAD(P)-dependent oxidoreductase [Thiomicrospira sp.]
MKIAIFGASSQIARDLIVNLASNRKDELVLYGRALDVIKSWCQKKIPSAVYEIQDFVSFDSKTRFDVIINFVGVGNPVLAKEMGSKIFEITEEFDAMALSNLEEYPDTKYIFLSSGAVYGGMFHEPVDESSKAQFDINHLSFTDWYAIAKFYAEVRHRALSQYHITDIRVFNYFSASQDLNARFLISDMIRAIKEKSVMVTSGDNIVRDFIIPEDFYALVCSIIDSPSVNQALDCYTKAPVDKFTLLEQISNRYGLEYRIEEKGVAVNATGIKHKYYSVNHVAGKLGYQPTRTSLEGILEQVALIA